MPHAMVQRGERRVPRPGLTSGGSRYFSPEHCGTVDDRQDTRALEKDRLTARGIMSTVVPALFFVLLGFVNGVRSSWMAHGPSVVSGTAERVPADVA